MPFIEAPGNFYLGRQYDLSTNKILDDIVYYDSRDLTSHAVVLGSAGSGKSGLCIGILEEAILDNIPIIVIDTLGKASNLLLTMPNLTPEEFRPWISSYDAYQAGLSEDEFAEDVSQRWHDGLASWGISAKRLQYFGSNARFKIFTPGSDIGLPISIQSILHSPTQAWTENTEIYREQIRSIVIALLTLVDINTDPITSREHVLITKIFEFSWQQGVNLTIEDIIIQIQQPPFDKLGVFDVETFFPKRNRLKLAKKLNYLVEQPGFQQLFNNMGGQPLDIERLLDKPNEIASVNIFSLSHLDQNQRMFFIVLLLEGILGYMRTLSGTTRLRTIIYFDEIAEYFPAYPQTTPSQSALRRLLKQGRAFGIGLLLASQVASNLDYKSLSYAGTWFIGHFQAKSEQNAILTSMTNTALFKECIDMDTVSELISKLESRIFLTHNVHMKSGPIILYTRWTMSYLRGSLSRDEITRLMHHQKEIPDSLVSTDIENQVTPENNEPNADKIRAFLSYSRIDATFMSKIRDDLVLNKMTVWTNDNLQVGTPAWTSEIAQAIENSDVMIVLLSPNAKESPWVERELIYAEDQDVRIFPVLIRGNKRTAIPFALSAHQRIDARDDYDNALQKLINAIHSFVHN